MMRLLDLRGINLQSANVSSFVPRLEGGSNDIRSSVRELIEDVRGRGLAALIEQAERFDGVTPTTIRVDEAALRQAKSSLDSALRRALEVSIERVRAASEDIVPEPVTTRFHSGGSVTTRFVPVHRAGVYVPGGKAVYPSSVIMNVVAAQVAGVSEIVLASPPQREWGGGIHPTIAAAAELLGVTEVYAMGGAGAIAAFAYGVPEIGLAPVSIVTGPGNAYVAAAKSELRGVLGIDSEAGPTEIGIIADDTANPEYVAADLISQAEHDELAQAVLITTSSELADRVALALERRVPDTANAARIRASLTGSQSAVMVVDSLDHAVLVSNALAPEHLQVMVEDPESLLPRLVNAGAIFVGDFTPVSAGDYSAGSNHVLPTAGSARFSSGLSPLTFLRTQQVVDYDQVALEAIADHVVALANEENLPAHGEAIIERFRED